MFGYQLKFGTRKCMDDEKLARLEEEFRRTAEYVLHKNAELYRRLSWCGVLHQRMDRLDQ